LKVETTKIENNRKMLITGKIVAKDLRIDEMMISPHSPPDIFVFPVDVSVFISRSLDDDYC